MSQHGTWLDLPDQVEAVTASLPQPMFAEAAPHLQGIGKSKVVLLTRIVEKVMGRPLDSGEQQTGDCAGWTGASAVDVCACVDVLLHQRQQEHYSWDQRCCVEFVYAMAREQGNYLGKDAGATIAWVASALLCKGTISRQYLRSPYSGRRADAWGRTGAPRKHLPVAQIHQVGGVSRVTTPDQVRDSVCAGHPVLVGFQGLGFNGKRDKQGFCLPKGDWNHAMPVVGYRSDIEGFLIKNHSSDAEHASEPQGEHMIPGSCFWVRPDIMARMLRCGDSWSVVGFEGYRRPSALTSLEDLSNA